MTEGHRIQEQIIAVLREQEAGVATADVCRKHGISSATFYAWKAKFGGMDVSEAKRLKALGGGERQAEAAAGRRHARQRRLEGSPHKKILTPAAKREAVAHLTTAHEMSERRACQVIRADRKMVRYRSRRPADAELRSRLRELAAEQRRFGYRRLHVLLRHEGHVVNRKKTQRLYREEGLSVRRRRGRKRATGTRAPLLVETKPNARWSIDFVPRPVRLGRRFRILNVIDDVTKECLATIPDTSISGRRVARELADDHPPTGQARPHRLGSRNRVHLQRDARLDADRWRRLALHRAGQADAERHLRSLQRAHAR